ncbi:hypothetical protein PPERSA_00565 [Pseudocohnilembus persalinus]|uniref:Uncharacterized protein n=1 Tax=Pseudocohnilembus persalinus TaxID=266149 RepID=A0A0V0QTD6_PSEPJ|nr:hypothetical protein PPERSA_00565 [Pseudocohnilembus persalinus]|eukprot:KRX05264.1 hypothetical protein PPERSA_00565 [Pseudocohnilembus persalinus]
MILNKLNQTFSKIVFKNNAQIRLTSSVNNYFSSENNNNNINNSENKSQNSEVYVHKVNYNMEQHKKYTNKVKASLKEKEDREIYLKEADPIDLIPRRRRRKYDRPKYDLELTNYGAWRVFYGGLIKNHQNGYPVVCKINIAPKIFKKVFGEGMPASKNENRSTREYDFEDNNGDYFLVYDWKATTEWHGNNQEGYDYENQDHIYPKDRKIRYPTVEEFWESNEPFQFRVNCSRYADFRKFQRWILKEVEEKQNGPSLDEIVLKKFGAINNYDDYNVKDYEIHQTPPVFIYNKSFWDDKQQQEQESGKKKQKKKKDSQQKDVKQGQEDSLPYHDQIKPSRQLDDKYLVKEEELLAEDLLQQQKQSQQQQKQ